MGVVTGIVAGISMSVVVVGIVTGVVVGLSAVATASVPLDRVLEWRTIRSGHRGQHQEVGRQLGRLGLLQGPRRQLELREHCHEHHGLLGRRRLV